MASHPGTAKNPPYPAGPPGFSKVSGSEDPYGRCATEQDWIISVLVCWLGEKNAFRVTFTKENTIS